jgi:hypothetical protein
MNKDQIINCFFKRQTKTNVVQTLLSQHSSYFSKEEQQPENLSQKQSCQFSANFSKKKSELDDSLSFYTALSRLTIDQSLLDDILTNKANHSPFCTIEKSKDENYKWYFQNESEEIYGPLTAEELDRRYQLGSLSKKCKVKTRGDDSYAPILNYLKRYCKIIKNDKFQPENDRKAFSNKIKQFKKGEIIKGNNHFKNMTEFQGEFVQIEPQQRTRTEAPRPVFNLNNLVGNDYKKKGKEDIQEEDEDEIPMTRERAKTHV